MDKISVLDKTFVPFIGHDELMGCIDSVAERINKDFEGATDVPIVLCILNGAIMFTGELMQRLNRQGEHLPLTAITVEECADALYRRFGAEGK